MNGSINKLSIFAFVWAIVFALGPFFSPTSLRIPFLILMLLNAVGAVLGILSFRGKNFMAGIIWSILAIGLSLLGFIFYTLFYLADKGGFV